VPEQPVAIFTDAELRRLLDAARGNSFQQRRVAALVRVFLDSGCRAAEVNGLRLADVDLDGGVIVVMGKGRRSRSVPIGARTAEALARYLRVRGRHRSARLPDLWLGSKGVLTISGQTQVLHRLGTKAGVPGVHPHRFRHSAAHSWLAAGGQERSLMRLMGWRSPAMLSRYGASAADARARDESRRMALGDRL
jgi:integrase